jgi:hypothetical protein
MLRRGKAVFGTREELRGVYDMSSSAPKLLDKETNPPSLSLYLEIQLGNGAPPWTGVFFPSGYQVRDSIELILYFHGHKTKKSGNGDITGKSVKEIWNKERFQLREELNRTDKNAVLVVPTLSDLAESGTLVGKFEWFLEQVKAGIIAYGPNSTKKGEYKPQWGDVVLACHSGGGASMLPLAEKMAGAKATGKIPGDLRECWCYDCLYGGGDGKPKIPPKPDSTERRWYDWAKSSGDLLKVYWNDTKERAKGLDWLAKRRFWATNVLVFPEFFQRAMMDPNHPEKEPEPKEVKYLPAPPDHNLIPKTYFAQDAGDSRLAKK